MFAVATRDEVAGVVEGREAEREFLGRPLFRVGDERLLVTGVGTANAAATLSAALHEIGAERVVSCGLAGALPDSGLDVGDVVVGTEAVYADLGTESPEGFGGMRELGFETSPGRYNHYPLEELAIDAPSGKIAEVCTVSATDERAREVEERTGASVESMETAAVAHTAALHDVPASAVVAVSNYAGDERGFDFESGRRALEDAVGGMVSGADSNPQL